jgi:hypothetical protein
VLLFGGRDGAKLHIEDGEIGVGGVLALTGLLQHPTRQDRRITST